MLDGGEHVQRYIRASAISDCINELGEVRILHISILLIIPCFPCARPKKPINKKEDIAVGGERDHIGDGK